MIIPSARDCYDITSATNTAYAYFCLALKAIADALATPGTYSCTLTTSGKQGADVQAVRQALLNLGFRLTQTTTTITIRWDESSPAVAINY